MKRRLSRTTTTQKTDRPRTGTSKVAGTQTASQPTGSTTTTGVRGTGPKPIPQGKGRIYMSKTLPMRTVDLDAGVFDYLWRVVEARYTLESNHTIPEHGDLLRRAVEQFRTAAGTINDGDAPPAKSKRKIKRR